jgi:hypothetical protein
MQRGTYFVNGLAFEGLEERVQASFITFDTNGAQKLGDIFGSRFGLSTGDEEKVGSEELHDIR